MKKKVLVSLFALMFTVSLFSLPIQKAHTQSWLTGWTYRKSHVIHHASGAGTNYQIRIVAYNASSVDNGENVYLDNQSRSDFGDVRFTDDDGTTLLDYWVEEKVDSDYAVFWVEVKDDLSSSDVIIYLYYGNSDATTVSSGFNTFPFFEDFDEVDLVNESSNPTRQPDDAWEGAVVTEQSDFHVNGEYISWYRGHSGTSSRVGFENSTDGVSWTPYAANPLFSTTSAYAYVVQDGDCFYLFLSNLSSPEVIYLYNVTDYTSPVLMNGGDPVLEPTEAWESNIIQNVAVEIVDGTWHLLYETGEEVGYAYSTLAEMNWTAHKSPNNPLFATAGNPYLKYVEDRDGMLLLMGYVPGTYWTIRAWYADLSDPLDEASSWHLSSSSTFIIQETNIHIADPHMMDNFNSTYPIMISYNYDQASTYQKYSAHTLNDFYDLIVGGVFDDKWEGDTDYATVSNSMLTFEGEAAVWKQLYVKSQYYQSSPIAIRQKTQFVGATANKGSITGVNNATTENSVQIMYFGNSPSSTIRCREDGVWTSRDSNLDTTERIYDILWISTKATFRKDDVEMTNSPLTTNVPTTSLPLMFESVGEASYAIKCDWILCRKLTASGDEPQHGSWGFYPPPYAFQFYGLYNEDTGLLYELANRAVNVTAHYVSGVNMTTTFEVNGSYTFYSTYQPLYFKFDLANPREYWLGTSETSGVIYIFNVTSTVYTIDFIDLAGALEDYPFVTAKRYINGTAHIIEKRKVDVEKKIIMALKNGEKYTITIQDGSSYEYGDLLLTSTTTITLTLKGIEFPQNIILAYRYVRLYAERHNNFSSISMLYEDLDADTDNVVCNIKYRNGTVAYTSTQYANSFNVTWTSANENITYFVEMDSTHNDYGTINYRATLYRSQLGTQPWDLTNILGSIPGMATADLIPTFIIICVAALFSKVNAYVGGFMAIAFAIFLTWYGWISIPAGMIVTALFLVIIVGLVAHKARSGT